MLYVELRAFISGVKRLVKLIERKFKQA